MKQSIIYHLNLLHCHFQVKCKREMVITISKCDSMCEKTRVLKYRYSTLLSDFLRIFAYFKRCKIFCLSSRILQLKILSSTIS